MIFLILILIVVILEIKYSPRLDISDDGIVLWYSVKDVLNNEEHRDYIKIT